ncbi:MAG: 1,4-dihydroxy-2-naphthoate polyprenyltransferase [Actinomycetota bacterium]|jgi:1,4-dihydroxy-2-naphthoate octaprenyltransferase|nr:1,4-dihydroxy-2-naphthoate polyprenyltransferase [Actinomycetota bacterium]
MVATWGRIMKTCGCTDPRALDPFGRILLITRACVQPMTLTSAAIAGTLASAAENVHWDLFALSSLGIVVAHAANNMINDYFDHAEGLDTVDYPRTQYAPHPVDAGVVTKGGLGRAILFANAIDLVIMVLLVAARGWAIAAFAVAGLFISVAYVAPPLRLKAKGLGEPSVFIIWGPLMVGGTYYAATGTIPGDVVWASVPYALLVTTVLMGKHIDKLEWDRTAGVFTLPVLLGEEKARWATRALFAAFYLSVAGLVIADVLTPWALLAVLAGQAFIRVWKTFGHDRPQSPPERYPLWPLWFGPWAFLHARRAGALLVLGMLLGAVF